MFRILTLQNFLGSIPKNNFSRKKFTSIFNLKIFNFNSKRYYTKYFPDTNENSGLDIAAYSISRKNDWVCEIEKWQNPILTNK